MALYLLSNCMDFADFSTLYVTWYGAIKSDFSADKKQL